MLKNIPAVISPELMKIMMLMGHGDELVIADGNFPAASNTQRLIGCDGHHIPELLEQIIKFFPLDSYVKHPATLMNISPGEKTKPKIWETYQDILRPHLQQNQMAYIDRFEFYKRARSAFAIVATSESALYANIILKKGVIGKD